jgi:exodeoxyribonuclease III
MQVMDFEQMIIASWNVNSLTVRLEHLKNWLKTCSPDVVCLQETKLVDEKFPHDAFLQLGYRSVCFGQKTYNGVAILSRLPMLDVVKGFAGDGPDDAKRFIGANIDGIAILNTYVPNGQAVGSEKYNYKLDWIANLQKHIEQNHQHFEKVLWCGDFNIAPQDIDVYDAQEYGEQIMCSTPERQSLEKIGKWGFRDAFRLYTKDGGHFSWWDYRMGAFRRNLGFRIDHIWITQALADQCSRAWIDIEPRRLERPSDHVPVLAEFKLT